MKIHRDLIEFNAKKPIVTIGTFDGVHRGHHAVLSRLKEIAGKTGGETVIFTFSPHPRQVLKPEENSIRILTTMPERIALLEKAGIDHLVIYPFTLEFSKLSYSTFVESVLVDLVHTSCLVVGYDHRFGNNREGSYDYLKKCAEKFNFTLERMEALTVDEVKISSTKIRNALEAGNVRLANEYLGYQYQLHGEVVQGRQIGRELGFPTANIEASEPLKLIPGYGVYAVKVEVAGNRFGGMLNIGTRPTFNHNADLRSIEVHVFNFNGTLYGREVTLTFVDKIRDEQKFSGKEALAEQLKADKQKALQILDM